MLLFGRAHEVKWRGDVKATEAVFFFSFLSDCNLKCNYFIHNWWRLSSQVSLSFWLLARSLDAFR